MNAWLLLTLLHLLQQFHRENFHELSSIREIREIFPLENNLLYSIYIMDLPLLLVCSDICPYKCKYTLINSVSAQKMSFVRLLFCTLIVGF